MTADRKPEPAWRRKAREHLERLQRDRHEVGDITISTQYHGNHRKKERHPR